jgi:hypothetical protein
VSINTSSRSNESIGFGLGLESIGSGVVVGVVSELDKDPGRGVVLLMSEDNGDKVGESVTGDSRRRFGVGDGSGEEREVRFRLLTSG